MLAIQRLLFAATVSFCVGLVSDQARAVVLDMENFAPTVPPFQTSENNANRVMGGFNLFISHGHFTDSAGAASPGSGVPVNGTDWLMFDNMPHAPPTSLLAPLQVTKVGGGAFSLSSFDATFYALAFNGTSKSHVIDVTGTLFGGGTINTSFTIDDLAGFQTFSFGAGWSNLTAVSFQNTSAAMAYDNIVVGDPSVSAVPLPAALPLFATILAGGGLIAWRRKRRNLA